MLMFPQWMVQPGNATSVAATATGRGSSSNAITAAATNSATLLLITALFSRIVNICCLFF
jgi:hypothetical protein